MKDFEYFTPKTVKEAISLLAKFKGEGKIFSGGQSMLVLMKQNMLTPEYVVDIKGCPSSINMNYDAKKGLTIGALTTHRTIEKSSLSKRTYPVLSEMRRTWRWFRPETMALSAETSAMGNRPATLPWFLSR